jgi:hypothetical protein
VIRSRFAEERSPETEIPKRIFTYWDSGLENAPGIVKDCVKSWVCLNPSYEVVVLDDRSIGKYLYQPQGLSWWENLPIQKKANLVRLRLLLRYGGFWVDATLLCTKPLDEWVDRFCADGFIALRRESRPDKVVRNFFLGAVPNSPIVQEWLTRLEKVLTRAPGPMDGKTERRFKRRYPLLLKSRWGTVFWTIPAVYRRFGYPYFIMHYLMNRMERTRRRWRRVLHRMPSYHSGSALTYSKRADGVRLFLEGVQSDSFPMWKLSWKQNLFPQYWSGVESVVSNIVAGLPATTGCPSAIPVKNGTGLPVRESGDSSRA